MKFIIDAQLPKRFCTWLEAAGHDTKHTLDLPLGNRTPDNDILELAEKEKRIVVTKDDDFVQSYLVTGKPEQLLFVATGNISNNELEKLLQTNLEKIEKAFEEYHFIEIGKDILAIHE
jgi:predicted nuclease of predicted toxin-antitoxin system